MKKLLFTILTLSAITSASAQIHNKPSIFYYYFQWPDYVEYQTYEILFSETDDPVEPSEIYEVTSRDETGRVLTQNYSTWGWDKQKHLYNEIVYTYNDAGQIACEDDLYESRPYRKIYTYSNEGNLASCLGQLKDAYGPYRNTSQYDYWYDDQGRLASFTEYDFVYNGSVARFLAHSILHYNELGQISCVDDCREYDDNDKWIPYITKEATYDDNGNRISCVESYKNKETGTMEPTYTYTYTYNEHGDLLTETLSYASDKPSKTTTYTSYTYDEKGRLTGYLKTEYSGWRYQYKYTYEDTESSIQETTITPLRSCKTIENGHIVIIHGDKRYNVVGQKM